MPRTRVFLREYSFIIGIAKVLICGFKHREKKRNRSNNCFVVQFATVFQYKNRLCSEHLHVKQQDLEPVFQVFF